MTEPVDNAETSTQPAAIPAPPIATAPRPDEEGLVVEDLLVEDVSIDGMCGVY